MTTPNKEVVHPDPIVSEDNRVPSDLSSTEQPQEKESNTGCWIAVCLFGIGSLVLSLTGNLFITTEACTLPLDLVLWDVCVFGSLGASVGVTVATFVLFSVIGLFLRLIAYWLRK